MNFYIHRTNLKNNQVQLQKQYHLNLPEVAKSRPEKWVTMGSGNTSLKVKQNQKKCESSKQMYNIYLVIYLL